jgi:hypothetical protein
LGGGHDGGDRAHSGDSWATVSGHNKGRRRHRHVPTGGGDVVHADRTGLTNHAPGQIGRGREGAATGLVGPMKGAAMVGPTDAETPDSRATVALATARVEWIKASLPEAVVATPRSTAAGAGGGSMGEVVLGRVGLGWWLDKGSPAGSIRGGSRFRSGWVRVGQVSGRVNPNKGGQRRVGSGKGR